MTMIRKVRPTDIVLVLLVIAMTLIVATTHGPAAWSAESKHAPKSCKTAFKLVEQITTNSSIAMSVEAESLNEGGQTISSLSGALSNPSSITQSMIDDIKASTARVNTNTNTITGLKSQLEVLIPKYHAARDKCLAGK